MSNDRLFLCPQCFGKVIEHTTICPHCVYDLSGFDYSRAAPANAQQGAISDHAALTNAALPPPGMLAGNIGGVVAVILICLVLGGGIVMATMGSWTSNSRAGDSAGNDRNPAPPNGKTITTTGLVVGRTGRLITDVNLRRESNKNTEVIGTHFMNARVQIMSIESYPLDGEISTWYRVKVLSYGCSADSSLGCGKKYPYDANEGWMNSKYITIE